MPTSQDIQNYVVTCTTEIDSILADMATGTGVFSGTSEANFLEAYTLLINQRVQTYVGNIGVMLAEYAIPPENLLSGGGNQS